MSIECEARANCFRVILVLRLGLRRRETPSHFLCVLSFWLDKCCFLLGPCSSWNGQQDRRSVTERTRLFIRSSLVKQEKFVPLAFHLYLHRQVRDNAGALVPGDFHPLFFSRHSRQHSCGISQSLSRLWNGSSSMNASLCVLTSVLRGAGTGKGVPKGVVLGEWRHHREMKT